MKVLYISHEGALNGAPKSLVEYLSVIMTKGVIPIVVVPEKGLLYRVLKEKKIQAEIVSFQQCIGIKKDSLWKKKNYVIENIKAVNSLCNIIRKEKVDIVHSNSVAVDVGAIAAYLCNKPHVWHLREYLEEDFNSKFRFPKVTIKLLKKSVYRISIANGIQKKYRKKYGISTNRIYNGINEEKYYHDILNRENEEAGVKLLIAGTISEGKGQWDAIRAVEILRSRGEVVHLDIVGDGVQLYVNHLRKYVRDHGLLDYISFQKYTNALQSIRLQSDIILTCSRMEAFGRVTAEAMMAGKIVIGANSGGTKDLIGEEEQRGYLYTYNCPQELANKIQYVMSHQEEKEKKEKEAQQYILKLTNLNNYTDKLLKIYEKILYR